MLGFSKKPSIDYDKWSILLLTSFGKREIGHVFVDNFDSPWWASL